MDITKKGLARSIDFFRFQNNLWRASFVVFEYNGRSFAGDLGQAIACELGSLDANDVMPPPDSAPAVRLPEEEGGHEGAAHH